MNTYCCIICKEVKVKTGKNQKVCDEPECRKEIQRIRTQEYRRRKAKTEGRLHRVDIGRGQGQPIGKDSAHYKTGIAMFHKLAPLIRKARKVCNRCNKNLLNANKDDWCVHHIDHDRTNNEISNFELLCKRCHQVEHKCWEAFETSTTIR